MRIAKRTLLTLLTGLALTAAASAQGTVQQDSAQRSQGNKPNIGSVEVIVKDISTKQDIAIVIGANISGKEILLGNLRTLRPNARSKIIDQTTEWSSNAAMGSHWVPIDALDALLELIQEWP